MDLHVQGREGAEQLGSAVLLAAFDDLMVSEYVLEPGTEPGDPHYHANHSDAFYVLEGELEFQIDGRTVRATAGTLVVAPRGAAHAFPVAIGSRARFLNIHTRTSTSMDTSGSSTRCVRGARSRTTSS